jgi:hypothetical protein
MTPYEEGAEAYRRGDCLDMNPFDFEDGQYEQWQEGWFDEEEKQTLKRLRGRTE